MKTGLPRSLASASCFPSSVTPVSAGAGRRAVSEAAAVAASTPVSAMRAAIRTAMRVATCSKTSPYHRAGSRHARAVARGAQARATGGRAGHGLVVHACRPPGRRRSVRPLARGRARTRCIRRARPLHRGGSEWRHAARQHALPLAATRAPWARDRLDVAHALGLVDRGECRGEAPAARARLREAQAACASSSRPTRKTSAPAARSRRCPRSSKASFRKHMLVGNDGTRLRDSSLVVNRR